jgi:hypothetical protein
VRQRDKAVLTYTSLTKSFHPKMVNFLTAHLEGLFGPMQLIPGACLVQQERHDPLGTGQKFWRSM